MKFLRSGFLTHNQSTAKIPTEELLVGMYVSQLDKAWKESDFIFQGFIIENDEMLRKVKNQCSYVYIDLNKQSIHLPISATQLILSKVNNKPHLKTKHNYHKHKTTTTPEKNQGPYRLKDIFNEKVNIDQLSPPDKLCSFEQEINKAQQAHLKASHIVRNLLHETGNGKPINMDIAKKAVYDCMHSVLRTPDAMLLMTQLRHQDRYTWDHSMNVCILAISLGRHLNLRYDELITLGLCGMFHDMGKMRIPTEILNKTGKYSKEEKLFMESHTTLGMQILTATPHMADIIAEVAYSHHERIDGKGYPRGLSSSQISSYAKIISVVDMYDALTTDRAFQKSKTHIDAINTMLKVSGSQIDEQIVYRFIQCIGVYPAGSLVEMNTGEFAIVLETNPEQKLRPKVMLISDQKGSQTSSKLINLSAYKPDNSNPYFIKTIIKQDKVDLDINNYFKYGTIQKELHIN